MFSGEVCELVTGSPQCFQRPRGEAGLLLSLQQLIQVWALLIGFGLYFSLGTFSAAISWIITFISITVFFVCNA